MIELNPSSTDGVRLLLADDFAPLRSKLRQLLQCIPEWTIVGEACDGLEAVEKTVELHPDVILLDINMPGMNGIEALKRIRRLAPDSRVIILTQETGEEMQAAALQAGAEAYVCKSEMATALIPAVQAALQTKRAK